MKTPKIFLFPSTEGRFPDKPNPSPHILRGLRDAGAEVVMADYAKEFSQKRVMKLFTGGIFESAITLRGYEQFMMDIAGAAEIPATKLFGRAPQGMDATGEGDLRNYYDTVKQNQETYLRPVLDKLLPILCMSTWGAVPDDLGFDFSPIRDTSDEERANMIQQTTGAINSAYQSGIISQRIAMKELRQAGEPLGMWTNITDEDIENADPSLDGGAGEDDMGEDPMAAMFGGGDAQEMPSNSPEAAQQPAGGAVANMNTPPQ